MGVSYGGWFLSRWVCPVSWQLGSGGVVPRHRFENGSFGMNIRIRAEEMCCD